MSEKKRRNSGKAERPGQGRNLATTTTTTPKKSTSTAPLQKFGPAGTVDSFMRAGAQDLELVKFFLEKVGGLELAFLFEKAHAKLPALLYG